MVLSVVVTRDSVDSIVLATSIVANIQPLYNHTDVINYHVFYSQ